MGVSYTIRTPSPLQEFEMLASSVQSGRLNPWNKGKLVGQKAPLKLRDIWAIRVRLELPDRKRDIALFNLAIVMRQKTRRPVQFEITEPTRKSVVAWIRHAALKTDDFLFPSRIQQSAHLSTRQYARIVGAWIREIGLDARAYGTHTMRRTKASLIYRRTKNLRAVQLLLGHSKLDYLPCRTMSHGARTRLIIMTGGARGRDIVRVLTGY